MYRSYLLAALRNLARNKVHSVINIAGLALGLAVVILIGLYVRDDFSYDRWLPGYRHVYRVVLHLEFGNLRQPPSAGTAAPVGGWLKADFPQIAAVGRMRADERTLRHADVSGKEQVYWADPEIFDVLPLPVMTGDVRRALEAPDAVVLTRRMARKYFGRDDPVGDTLRIDGEHVFRVAAVLEDLPAQTHLNTDIFISGRAAISTLPAPDAPLRMNVGFDVLASVLTYIRLQDGADAGAIERALPQVVARHVAIPRGPTGKPLVPAPTLELQSLAAIHFVPAGLHAMKPSGSLAMDYAVSGIAVLILLIAGFNFVNLATARAARRAVEVGVRKVSGATSGHLLAQFLGESLLAVAIATLLAVAVVEMLTPDANALLSRQMTFAWWRDSAVGGDILLMMIVTGVLAGLYPAVVLSRFRPTAVLNGGPVRPGGRAAVRETLVVLQFAILIGLIIATGIVFLQTRFATTGSLGFDTDRILAIRTDCLNALPDEIRALPGVQAAACTDTLFGLGGGISGVISRPGSPPVVATVVSADWGLLELFGLKPIAGRFFSKSHASDAATIVPGQMPQFLGSGGAVVINETAVHWLGFTSAAAAVGHSAVVPGQDASPLIIGVTPDINLQGVRHEIPPTLFRVIPRYQYLIVKLAGSRLPETLAAIDGLWRRLGDGQPVSRSFLDDDIAALNLDTRRETEVFALLAGLALFIAGIGLFGLSAFIAEQRTKEIGIRKSMGASTIDVMRLLLLQFSKPVLAANLIAWPVAGYFMNRWLHGFFYHIDLGWQIFVAAGAAAYAVALVTVSAHSYIVARARPVAALRYE